MFAVMGFDVGERGEFLDRRRAATDDRSAGGGFSRGDGGERQRD
jgi:hypothetical protein